MVGIERRVGNILPSPKLFYPRSSLLIANALDGCLVSGRGFMASGINLLTSPVFLVFSLINDKKRRAWERAKSD